MQQSIVKNVFADNLQFDEICQFLTLKELLNLSLVSKQFRYIIESKCKTIIKQNNLNLIASKTCIHQMRFYFDRCLSIYKNTDKNLENQQTLLCIVQNQFKFNSTKSFQIGINFSGSLTTTNDAYIFKTQQLINENKQKVNKNIIKNLEYVKRTNVCQINAKCQNLLYLKTNGHVFQCISQKKSQKIIEKQQQLQWSINIPIQKMESSFNFSIFLPKNTIDQNIFFKYVFGYDIDLNNVNQQKKNDQKQSLMILARNNTTMEYYMVVFEGYITIQSIAVGSKQAYFIDQNYQCYIVEFQNIKQGQRIIYAKIFQPFKNKKIVKIASGYNYYLALQRNIQKIQQWTLQDVCGWMRQIGFTPFIKISIVEKLDGKKLLTIDKNYMHNSLGITKPNMQQKFMMELQTIIQNKNKSDQLYGWGKNQFGQLASNNANYINNPQKIKINVLKENQHIDSIFCGWFQTFIRTQKGRIYRTVKKAEKKKKIIEKQQQAQQVQQEVYQKKRKSSVIQTNLSSDDQHIDKKNYYKQQKQKNKKKKSTQDHKQKQQRKSKKEHHKKYQQEQKWIQCKNVGKAFFVQGFKEFSLYLQCPSQGNFQPNKQKKLRTAKTIINKIKWDEKLNQQEFVVGYIDKQMGLIESTVYQLQMFQLNQNRIKYIKKEKTIVWDRDNKIDHIN